LVVVQADRYFGDWIPNFSGVKNQVISKTITGTPLNECDDNNWIDALGFAGVSSRNIYTNDVLGSSNLKYFSKYEIWLTGQLASPEVFYTEFKRIP